LQGGGPVLDFSPKDTATVNGYFKRADIKILLTAEQRYAVCLGKPTIIKDAKIKMLTQLNYTL
jgi:SecD/SecF fusion protein